LQNQGTAALHPCYDNLCARLRKMTSWKNLDFMRMMTKSKERSTTGVY
jgi:hypothetical protein